jgi:uncharacterized membrane protein YfcA
VLVAAGFGLLIGTALGLLGGGGSILAVPALVYGVGESVTSAVTASLFIVGVSSALGAVPRARTRQVRWSVAAVFGVAGAATAFGGSAIGQAVSPQVLLLAFAGLMIVVAARMLVAPAEARAVCAAPGGKIQWRTCLPRAVAAGAVVGLLTGLFGVGGGFLIVPALLLLLGLDMNVAIGTSLVIIVVNSAAGLAAHIQRSSLDWPVTLTFAGAAVAASLAAGHLGSRIEAGRLQRWFAILIIAVAVFVAVAAIINPTALGR